MARGNVTGRGSGSAGALGNLVKKPVDALAKPVPKPKPKPAPKGNITKKGSGSAGVVRPRPAPAPPRAPARGNVTAPQASPAGRVQPVAHATPKSRAKPKANVTASKASPAGQIPRTLPRAQPQPGPRIPAPERPFAQAKSEAEAKTIKAIAKTQTHVVLPRIPKLAHPTDEQRQQLALTVLNATKKYNLDTPEKFAALPAKAKEMVNRAEGYQKTIQRNREVKVANLPTPKIPKGYRYENGLLFDTKTNLPVPKVEQDAILLNAPKKRRRRGTRKQQAAAGRKIIARQTSEGKPVPKSEHKQGTGLLATVLSPQHNIITQVAHGLGKTSVGKGIANTPGDVVNLASNAIPSTYHLATTLATRPGVAAKEFGQPFYEFGKNIVEGHPGRILEHPVPNYLLFAGGKAILGRGVGVVTRSGAVGKTAKRATALERAPKTLEGTSVTVPRQYSRDLFNLGAQKATEKARARKAAKLRAQAAKTSNPDEKAALLDQAHKVTQTHVKAKHLRRQEDERQDANATVARGNRNEATRAVDALKAEKHGPLVSLVAQRIVKPTVEDIRAYRNELVAQQSKLKHSRLRANRTLVKEIDKQLSGKGPDLAAVAEKANAYERLARPGQQALGDAQILSPEQIARRSLMPYAIRHMGAKHTTKGLVDDRGLPLSDAAIRAHMAKHYWPQFKPTPDLAAARNDLNAALAQRERAVAREQGPRIMKGRTKTDATKARQDFPSANDLERAGAGESGRPFAAANKPREALTPVDMANRKVAAAQARVDAAETAAKASRGNQTDPAFLSQAPNRRGARNYFKSDSTPARVANVKFTGEATRTGTFDAHPETLRENVANTQTLVDQQAGYKARLHEVAYKTKDNKPAQFTKRQAAVEQADALASRPGGIRWRVVRTNPFGGTQAQLEQLMQPDQVHVQHSIQSAIKGDGEGPFSLIPEETAARMEQHLALLGSGTGKAFQKFTGTFRKAVLSTNPKWLFGNIAEGGLRSVIMRAGPTSYVIGRRILSELERTDPEAAKALRARMGGGHYTMADRMDLHRAAEQFAHTDMEPLARALGAFWRAPGPRLAAGAWHAYTNMVFHTINGKAEFGIQTAMLGKAASRSPLMTGRLAKLSEDAINEAAKGLTDTNNQAMLAREIHRAYGQYNAFRPSVKRAIATYTPFLPWTLNALHFVLRVMPKDHPIVTAALVAANRANQDWLKQQNLDQFAPGAMPAFLQGTIPFGGGHVRASHYFPTGAFTDLPGTLAGAVLPQAQGALAAGLYGTDWKGKKLADQSSAGRAKAAALSLVEGLIPGFGQGQAILGHGIQGLNPLRPIAPSKGLDPRLNDPRLTRLTEQAKPLNKELKRLELAHKKLAPDGYATPEYQRVLDKIALIAKQRDAVKKKLGIPVKPRLKRIPKPGSKAAYRRQQGASGGGNLTPDQYRQKQGAAGAGNLSAEDYRRLQGGGP